jgi:hypothetical protein
MKGFRFDIRLPNGSNEVVVVDNTTARIGHGAHCEVRLALDQAASEHILVEGVDGVLRVSALTTPPPNLNGTPLTGKRAVEGSTALLELNGVRINLSAIADADADAGNKNRRKTIAYAACFLVLLGMMAFMKNGEDEGEPPRHEPKADLFAERPSACPRTYPEEALAYANDQLAIADAKSERHPFDPRDGVTAVNLYDVASICFRAAGREEAAQSAASAANELRSAIIADFRGRSLRLEYSLRAGDAELVAADLAVLRTLAEERKGPYYEWLVELSRQMKPKGK